MTVQLVHMQALERGIRAVRITKQQNPWFLLVELPDGSPAYIYYSNTLQCKLNRYLREIGSKNHEIQGINLYPVKNKTHNGIEFVVWEIVRPSTKLPPKFLLKDEN